MKGLAAHIECLRQLRDEPKRLSPTVVVGLIAVGTLTGFGIAMALWLESHVLGRLGSG